MTDREFRSLSKAQLIDILLELESIIDRLENDKLLLENSLNDRNIKVQKAGSLADASAAISGLFNSVQETADLYLDSILTIETKKINKIKQMEAEARQKADAVYKSADDLFSEAFWPFIDLVMEMHDLLNKYSQKLDLEQSNYNEILENMGFLDVKRELDRKNLNLLKDIEEDFVVPGNMGIRLSASNNPEIGTYIGSHNVKEEPEVLAVYKNELLETDTKGNINIEESTQITQITEDTEDTKTEEFRPSVGQITEEVNRRKSRFGIVKNIASYAGILAVFAAVSVLLSTYVLPVFNINQSSMDPTLENGEVVVFSAVGDVEKGDIVAFSHSNSLLIKRVIGVSGDLIDINDNGEVAINGVIIDEPYVSNPALGECDIELPFRVPEGRFFVMGDNREISLDSRYDEIGAVSEEQILGKALIRVLPLGKLKLF